MTATTTASEAVQALISGVPPSYTYLLRNVFRVLVDRKEITTARVVNYYAVDYEGLLRFQSISYGSKYAKLPAFLIPTTPGALVVNKGSFPRGSFATINLADPAGVRVLCTEQLTGCSIAFGWDKSTRHLHIGHAEPDDKIPQISTRANLSNYLRTHAAFEGVKLSQSDILFVGGNRLCWSDYSSDKANVIGFVSGNTVTIIVQVVMSDGKIRESWTMEFPPK